MKLRRKVITDRVIQRFKMYMIAFMFCICGSIISTTVKAYTWKGDNYDHLKIYRLDRGYVEIYSNRDGV